jgi:pimeloyl-ACP methyl ester carboxylesterase
MTPTVRDAAPPPPGAAASAYSSRARPASAASLTAPEATPPQQQPSSGSHGARSRGSSRHHYLFPPGTPVPDPTWTLLFSHGNGEDLGYLEEMLEMWYVQFRGQVRVVAYDYPGYGLTDGDVPTEAGANAAHQRVFRYLIEERGLPRHRVILAGRSLGSGPATDLASRQRGLGGLVILSGLMSAARVAGKMHSGLAWLIGADIFRNADKIGKVHDYPILIVHGSEDEVIAFEHAKYLEKAARKKNSRVLLTVMPRCGHNDIELRQPQLFYDTMRNFFDSLPLDPPALPEDDARGASVFSSCFLSPGSTTVKA